MLNSKYFQPMQHKPLPDIRKYALLSEHGCDFYAIAKPAGIDVYINNGHIYDMNHIELENPFLKFQFEKMLQTTINLKMTVLGVLVTTNVLELACKKPLLYRHTSITPFPDLHFVSYDCHFPVFNSDHIYKWRHDIVSKNIGIMPQCSTAPITVIKNELALENFVQGIFSIDAGTQIIVYKSEGKYVPGISQLLYENEDVVSYIINANQLFRAHVKRVISTTSRLKDGDKTDVAMLIQGKFKREPIEVPIGYSNLALRKFIWDKRQLLHGMPFWFTGHTYINREKDPIEYNVIINEFLSFLPTESINEIDK